MGGIRSKSPPELGDLGGDTQIIKVNNRHRVRGTTPEIEQAARKSRQNLTPAEAFLWSALRNRQLQGLRFRCQHPVGNFILDFYCPSCKLVVEVDGTIHDDQIEYDEARTAKLAEYGYKYLCKINCILTPKVS